jgi:hypothetical protein
LSPAELRPAEVRPAEVRLAEVRLAEVRVLEVRPAEVRLAEVRPAEIRPAELRLDEFRLDEACPAEVGLEQTRPAEVRLPEDRPAEASPDEVRPSEFRLTEVRPAEIGNCLRVLQPPLIPDSDSLFKDREMFGIRRGASESVGFATANDTLAPNCAAIYGDVEEAQRCFTTSALAPSPSLRQDQSPLPANPLIVSCRPCRDRCREPTETCGCNRTFLVPSERQAIAVALRRMD